MVQKVKAFLDSDGKLQEISLTLEKRIVQKLIETEPNTRYNNELLADNIDIAANTFKYLPRINKLRILDYVITGTVRFHSFEEFIDIIKIEGFLNFMPYVLTDQQTFVLLIMSYDKYVCLDKDGKGFKVCDTITGTTIYSTDFMFDAVLRSLQCFSHLKIAETLAEAIFYMNCIEVCSNISKFYTLLYARSGIVDDFMRLSVQKYGILDFETTYDRLCELVTSNNTENLDNAKCYYEIHDPRSNQNCNLYVFGWNKIALQVVFNGEQKVILFQLPNKEEINGNVTFSDDEFPKELKDEMFTRIGAFAFAYVGMSIKFDSKSWKY